TAERDRTLQAYTAAIGSLFHDYGITTDQPVTLSVAPSGRLEVDGDHPDAERIQSLLDDSPLLQAAATKVLSLTQALEMMALLQQGQTLHEQDAAAMYQALNLQLSGNAKGWVADVLLEGRLLASSAISHEAAKVDAAIARFDAQHHQHRIEQRE